MALRSTPTAQNPLARGADALPPGLLAVAEVLARSAGAAAVLLYAWQQYTELDSFFGRTWLFAVFVATLAVATQVPGRGWRGFTWRAAGPGALIFGGAMLAREIEGGVTLLCGVAAWLAVAAAEYRRSRAVTGSVAGLALAAALTFAVAISTALIGE